MLVTMCAAAAEAVDFKLVEGGARKKVTEHINEALGSGGLEEEQQDWF